VFTASYKNHLLLIQAKVNKQSINEQVKEISSVLDWRAKQALTAHIVVMMIMKY